MFKKVLIANRGEVALRIIRACQELGIATVAVYSEADKESLHTKLADEAICIGPSPAQESYLNVPSIMSAVEVTGADAIHPGYGFLAESHQFAEVCKSCEVTFIGPPVEVVERMGDKTAARRIARSAGVPVLPGTEEAITSEKDAMLFAKEFSYPIMIKAAGGGGGRGMRIAQSRKELLSLVKSASQEAEAAFGNSKIYLEKYLKSPRHIEFQILADSYGSVVHLGERECSIQRRHQKLLEESPSVALTPDLRQEMGKMAKKTAQAAGYTNAGTVEFLVDKDGNSYFIEMNTRVQVEHPVTETVTGVDIIKQQVKLAAGERLEILQQDVNLDGHAIEFRINAEDPDKNFMPNTGKIELYNPPGGPGIRVDSHLYSGYVIPSYYDSLLAKVIVWGKSRDEAIVRGKRALGEFIIVGVETTIPFHLKVLDNSSFSKGRICTDFIEEKILKS